MKHRILVCNSREWNRRDRLVRSEFFKQSMEKSFHDLEDIFLCDETHFQVELVKLARRPVSACIFVAITRSDLKIPIETRDHNQLFKHLRSLWKRVELSWMPP